MFNVQPTGREASRDKLRAAGGCLTLRRGAAVKASDATLFGDRITKSQCDRKCTAQQLVHNPPTVIFAAN